MFIAQNSVWLIAPIKTNQLWFKIHTEDKAMRSFVRNSSHSGRVCSCFQTLIIYEPLTLSGRISQKQDIFRLAYCFNNNLPESWKYPFLVHRTECCQYRTTLAYVTRISLNYFAQRKGPTIFKTLYFCFKTEPLYGPANEIFALAGSTTVCSPWQNKRRDAIKDKIHRWWWRK